MTGEQSRGDHSRSGLVLIAPGNRMQARLDVRRAILRSARLEAARVHAHVRPLAGLIFVHVSAQFACLFFVFLIHHCFCKGHHVLTICLTSIHPMQLPHPGMQWLWPYQWEILTTQKVGRIKNTPCRSFLSVRLSSASKRRFVKNTNVTPGLSVFQRTFYGSGFICFLAECWMMRAIVLLYVFN